jgi:hypothetical protein
MRILLLSILLSSVGCLQSAGSASSAAAVKAPIVTPQFKWSGTYQISDTGPGTVYSCLETNGEWLCTVVPMGQNSCGFVDKFNLSSDGSFYTDETTNDTYSVNPIIDSVIFQNGQEMEFMKESAGGSDDIVIIQYAPGCATNYVRSGQ